MIYMIYDIYDDMLRYDMIDKIWYKIGYMIYMIWYMIYTIWYIWYDKIRYKI